jgi:hypothetical protein
MQGNGIFAIVIIAAVLIVVIVRRGRSLFTRQKIHQSLLAIRLSIFAILGAAILFVTLSNAPSLLSDLVGLAVGAGIAGVGLRLTTFERRPDGLYYTPNKYIGAGVFALFLLRLVYKIVTGLSAGGALSGAYTPGAGTNLLSQITGDPLTTAVYFLLIGYYTCYYGLLILRSRQEVPA